MRNSARNIRIVIADDHPVVLLAIAEVIEAVSGFSIHATAHSGAELLDILAKDAFDLIITDFVMHQSEADEDGLRLIQRLKRLHPGVPVIVFTMLTNGGILHQMCRLGVSGLVGKDEKASILGEICLRALEEKHISDRQTILSPGIKVRLANTGTTSADFRRTQPLSPRELEVVRLFSLGLSLTEIAKGLNRSVPTVATQKRAAMRKLHIETNADLLRYATEQGLS